MLKSWNITPLKPWLYYFLARVDGKSPAEYITADQDKDLIRRISYGMLQTDIRTYRSLANYFLSEVGAF